MEVCKHLVVLLASLAKAQAVPVIAVCESYKFAERVQLDSIVSNELGSAQEISSCVGGGEDFCRVESEESAGPGGTGKFPIQRPSSHANIAGFTKRT